MKAKKVNEAQNFERSGDVNKSLNVGVKSYDFENPQQGDKLRLITDIYDTQYADSDVLNVEGQNLVVMEHLMEHLEVKYEKDQIFEFEADEYDWYPLNDDNYPINHWWLAKNAKHFEKYIK